MTDHDQRLKAVLKEFFPEFFAAYLPDWADRLDFSRVEWLDKEVFADPPRGDRRQLDLVARVHAREPIELQRPGDEITTADEWITLVHVEVESGESAAPLRPRMYEYYEMLRRSQRRPVLPVALLLRVGLDGIGREVFEEQFWELPVLRFEYLYIGLPALDAEAHVHSGNVLDAAFSAFMRSSAERRAWLRAEALRKIIESQENPWRTFLLGDLVQTYLPLEDAQQHEEFEEYLTKEEYMGVQRYGTTWYEEGQIQGQIQGQRKLITRMLENRFGPLSEAVRDRLEALPPERLEPLGVELLSAASLKELGLED